MEKKVQPTPVFQTGKFHGPKRLAGYSPWGYKESDTTEHTHRVIHMLMEETLDILFKWTY